MKLTRVEQDYLKCIYWYQEKNEDAIVPLKEIAEYLQVASPTVTEAVKRLEKKGLVTYISYKGVLLTVEGLHEARFIRKAHRVWEMFLLNELGYQEDEVHEEAEQLEHAATHKLVERLYTFLGNPKKCPHGDEIPTESFWEEQYVTEKLSTLLPAKRAKVIELSIKTITLLEKMGIKEIPTFLTIIERFTDGSILVQFDNHMTVILPSIFQENCTIALYK